MHIDQDQWIKIAELLEGSVEDQKLALCMINTFPMSGNRAQVVTLALLFACRYQEKQGEDTLKKVWGQHCKNWYCFLYNSNTGLSGWYNIHKEVRRGKVSQMTALNAWLKNSKRRDDDEREWVAFYEEWGERRGRKISQNIGNALL